MHEGGVHAAATPQPLARILTGAYLTLSSYERALGGFGRILILACLVLFAFTTMVNWAHFSERCFEYLGGRRRLLFRCVFVAVTFAGPFFIERRRLARPTRPPVRRYC